MVYRYIAIVVVILLSLIGCTKENSTAPEVLTDQDVIKQIVAEVDSIADFSASDEATIDDGGAQEWETSNLGKVSSPVTPILWGRKIDNIQRTIVIVMEGDTMATATITKMITGRLIILANYPDSALPDTFQKKFTQEIRRRVRFVRIASTDDVRKNWKPTALTTVLGQTNTKNFGITEVVIYTPQDTIIISDSLLQWFRFREGPNHIPILNVGDTIRIRLRVTSENSNSEYAMIRHCVHHRFAHRYRTRMGVVDSTESQGMYEREYEKRFAVRLPMGVDTARYNVILDIINYESINDDIAPFMNMFVGIPYIVKK